MTLFTHDGLNIKIKKALYRALEKLSVPIEVLAAVGSWGDTLDDRDVLVILDDFNEFGASINPNAELHLLRIFESLRSISHLSAGEPDRAAFKAIKKWADRGLLEYDELRGNRRPEMTAPSESK